MTAPASNEMFREAQVNIHGGIFTQVSGDYHNQVNHVSGNYHQFNQVNYNNHGSSHEMLKEKALKRLLEHIAPGAFHDSAERRDPPKCHPHTREAVIRDILIWAQNPSNLRLLMWIYGPAGAGKSAIMQTIAEHCAALGILAGSFFFFHGAENRSVIDHLIPTLAYQLAKRVPYFEYYLVAAIHDDPAIFSRNIESQMKVLILDPIYAATAANWSSGKHVYVILVDGLDECKLEASQREIISLLHNSASLCLRFIIASRPELAIRNSFSIPHIQNQTQTLALDDHYLPDDDIRLFLSDKFQEIKRSHILHHLLPHNWPGSNVMDTLVQNASGQFIYAATIIRYIESPRHNPTEHLATVLKSQLSPGKSDKPFALLDSLYHQIFAAVDDLAAVLDILRVKLFSNLTFPDWPSVCVETLLGYSHGHTQLLLCDMHSLLKFTTGDEYTYIGFHHKSLEDFLFDPSRSQHLHIDQQKSKLFVVTNFFKNFHALLPFDGSSADSDSMNISLSWATLQGIFYSNLDLTPKLAHILLEFMPSIIKISLTSNEFDDGESYSAMSEYFCWLKEQMPSHNLAATIYNLSINLLDKKLSTLITRQEIDSNALIILTYFLKLGVETCTKFFIDRILYSQYESSFTGKSDFISVLKQLATNPIYTTQQILDASCTSDEDLAFIIIKNVCPKLDIYLHSDLELFGEEIEYGNPMLQFIIEHLPHIPANLEIGQAIIALNGYRYSSYNGRCPSNNPAHCSNPDLCKQLREYIRKFNRKKTNFEISVVFQDYLQRCGISIEAHEYNSDHEGCFACQSKLEFLEDLDLGNSSGFLF